MIRPLRPASLPFGSNAMPRPSAREAGILAGIAKIAGPQPFLDHMAAHHIPGLLLPAVIALELGAGIAVMLGWQLPYAAGALALFCLATALGFHLDFADKAERSLFFKDLAIAGALMLIAAGAWRSSAAI